MHFSISAGRNLHSCITIRRGGTNTIRIRRPVVLYRIVSDTDAKSTYWPTRLATRRRLPRWQSGMPSPAALLVVPNGRATTAWQHVIRALGRERPTGRLYVLFQVRGVVDTAQRR